MKWISYQISTSYNELYLINSGISGSTFDGGNLVNLKENPAPEDVEDLEKLPKIENPNRIENHAFLTEMTIGKPLKLENKKERKKILFFEENEFISWKQAWNEFHTK